MKYQVSHTLNHWRIDVDCIRKAIELAGYLEKIEPKITVTQGYRLTWKILGTPFNRLRLKLVRSMLHTRDCEFSMLPTAMTQGLKTCENGKTKFLKAELLPTPTASGEENYETRANRHGHTKAVSYLSSYVQYHSKLLPTPMSSDSDKTTKASKQNSLHKEFQTSGTSQLSPLFVAEMMGFSPDWTLIPFLMEENHGGDLTHIASGEKKASKPAETQ